MRRRFRADLSPALTLLFAAVLAVVTIPMAVVAQPAPGGFTVDDVLTVENVRLAALSEDGRWAVATISTLEDRLGVDNYRYGDPTYVRPGVSGVRVIDTRTGDWRPLFAAPVQVEALAWSPDATRLAVLVRAGEGFEYRVWNREADRMRRVGLPGGLEPAVNTRLDPVWTRDGEALVLPLRAADWEARAGAAFRELVDGPVVVLDSEESFLAWEALRRLGGLHVLGRWDAATGEVEEVLEETMLLDLAVTDDGRIRYTVDVTEGTDYDRIFGTDGRVLVRELEGGEPVVVVENTSAVDNLTWARDGLTFAYAEDGKVRLGRVGIDEDRLLLGDAPETEPDEAAGDPDDDEAVPEAADSAEALRFRPVSFSPSGDRLIATAKGDHWFVDAATGDTTKFLDVDPDAERGPDHRVVGWLADDAVLVQKESRTEWLRELVRYEVEGGAGELHETRELLESVRLSRDGSTLVWEAAPAGHPTDLWAAEVDRRGLDGVERLVDVASSLDDEVLARPELVSYLDVDGDELYGVLYYPTDYDVDRAYPTILYVYEDFYDPGFNTFVNVMTSHGYAVMRPSVDLEIGFPGEAWLKGVTAAANELIRRGVADPDRLAVQGTSYGGYAVNLLVTQTDRFAAAVNVSGKVNMVSFYTDSPRLATRNIHAPEASQDRIGATLWEQPQKYVAHSAIMFADRVDTPMLLIGGDQDHNVPNRQLMEMYYALRRLGKDVTWVTYVHGGHGMPTTDEAMVRDYYRRILDFYGEHLGG
jgi:dipeptidyl aminopeptidase/acylaminoacyl peptidase